MCTEKIRPLSQLGAEKINKNKGYKKSRTNTVEWEKGRYIRLLSVIAAKNSPFYIQVFLDMRERERMRKRKKREKENKYAAPSLNKISCIT